MGAHMYVEPGENMYLISAILASHHSHTNSHQFIELRIVVCILLVKDDRGDVALDVSKRFKVAELASRGVALDNHDAAVALHADGDLGACLVHRELAGEAATGRDVLEKRQLAVVADGKVDHRVRIDLLGLVVEAGDLVDVFAARRGDKELVVRLRISPC